MMTQRSRRCILIDLRHWSCRWRPTGQARAQWGDGFYPYGYGGYGWGGWGATPQGSIAQGLGYFAMGAGIYNVDTAVARSINVDTVIRWNQYVYLSQQEATREYFARRNAEIAKDKNAYNALLKRIQENPTAHDVENGDALNACAGPALGPTDPFFGTPHGGCADPGQVDP